MIKKEKGLSAEELDKRMKEVESQMITFKNLRDELQEQEYSGDLVGEPSLAILKYISDNQDKKQGKERGLTKEEIAEYMDESDLASRPTTLKLIDHLLRANLIVNAKRRERTRNRLTINPDYGFKDFEVDNLAGLIRTLHKKFEKLTDENNDLVNDLLNMISNEKKKIKHK